MRLLRSARKDSAGLSLRGAAEAISCYYGRDIYLMIVR